MGTRPIDEVWLTPRTDMAVTEKATSAIGGRRRRVLILGVGLLPGFRVDALRAVLAHEYAHFVHGDTAGGVVALRVRSAMLRFADAINARGRVRPWDLTVWYLRFYYRLFNQLSYGASRLQEVLADRRAVELCGATAFVTGLEHVVRRDVEFNLLLNDAVSKAVRSEKQSVAFYAPSKALSPAQHVTVAAEVRNTYQLPESSADTHPSLMSRYAAARASGVDRPLGPGKATALFGEDVRSLAGEMLQVLNRLVEDEAKRQRKADEQLLEYIDSAIDADPTFDLVETRATLRYRVGDLDLALDDLDLLLEVTPNDLTVLLSRSNLHEVMENHNEAVRDLTKLQKHSAHLPESLRLEVAIRLGNIYYRFGKLTKAAAAYRTALRQQPDAVNALVGRLLVAEKAGDLADARNARPRRALMETATSRTGPAEARQGGGYRHGGSCETTTRDSPEA